MRHLFAIILAAVLIIGNGFFVSASEPDRIVQSLSIADYRPYDQPITVGTGTIEVRLKTSLTCAPPEGKTGCGHTISAILHAPVMDPHDPDTYPMYLDVLDQTSSMLCNGEPAIGCQATGPDSEFVYVFKVPRPGRYVLETISQVGYDYESPDIRLTTDHPTMVEAEIYPGQGVIYQIRGFASIDVYQVWTA